MIALPLLAASGHSGTVHPRTAPELSDIALFVVAIAAVWFVRRAMRRRFQKPPANKD
jgi:membrane protein implicated in regulation of membrane protease activity